MLGSERWAFAHARIGARCSQGVHWPLARGSRLPAPQPPTTGMTSHNTADDENLSAAGRRLRGLLPPAHVLRRELAQVDGAKLAHLHRSLRPGPRRVCAPVCQLATVPRLRRVGYDNVDAALLEQADTNAHARARAQGTSCEHADREYRSTITRPHRHTTMVSRWPRTTKDPTSERAPQRLHLATPTKVRHGLFKGSAQLLPVRHVCRNRQHAATMTLQCA